MQVTLTHINGKPIQDRRQVRVINTVNEFEECVNECCRLPDNERWFSTCRVERLRAISTTHSVEDMLGTVTLASRSGSTLFTPSCKN